MELERASQADDELVTAFARLLPQLNPSPALPDRAYLEALVADPRTYLLLARDPGIVGTLTLTVYPLPTGLHGQINAVVVDHAERGRGIGEALTREALRYARAAGAYRVMLTSRDTRKAAHRMYVRAGFETLGSHVFRRML
jgi:ribosomal protein S18 acetylase RimI-like enzyme